MHKWVHVLVCRCYVPMAPQLHDLLCAQYHIPHTTIHSSTMHASMHISYPFIHVHPSIRPCVHASMSALDPCIAFIYATIHAHYHPCIITPVHACVPGPLCSDADRLREKQRQAEERKKALAAGLPDPYPKGKPSKADNKKKAALSKKKKGKK